MALGWAEVTIAGVDIKDASGLWCRSVVLDKDNLRSGYTGSTDTSLDGTPLTQLFPVSAYGRAYGVTIKQCPLSVRDAVLAAIEDALGAAQPFRVQTIDPHDNFDYRVYPDWKAGWFREAPQERVHNVYVRDITFRFVTDSAGA